MSEFFHPSVAIDVISANADDFRRKVEPDQAVMLSVLLRELSELSAALFDHHDDSPEYELIQIGGVVVNMLRNYTDDQLYDALHAIRVKHHIRDLVPAADGDGKREKGRAK